MSEDGRSDVRRVYAGIACAYWVFFRYPMRLEMPMAKTEYDVHYRTKKTLVMRRSCDVKILSPRPPLMSQVKGQKQMVRDNHDIVVCPRSTRSLPHHQAVA